MACRRISLIEANGIEHIPMLGGEVVAVILVRDVQPSVLVFEYFADGAAFYAKDGANVFLTGIRVL